MGCKRHSSKEPHILCVGGDKVALYDLSGLGPIDSGQEVPFYYLSDQSTR